jgi:ABC-type Na+ transport system ATPase subunit NatA
VILKNLCLEGTLTIKETFEYYGTLYSMDKKNIDIKIDELNTYLQLPNLNSLVKDIRYDILHIFGTPLIS